MGAPPRISLGVWPTPLRRLSLDGLPLWVKDEGACGAVYGGNKVRKLELLLGDALARGRTDLLTLGAVGSHHVLATALYGREHGLRTHALLFPQPDHPHARDVAARNVATCASVTPVWSLAAVPMEWAEAWLRLVRRGVRPYRIPAGGSNRLATIGWIEAGRELAGAIRSGELPGRTRVYAALGTGGTVAGLWAGLRLEGLENEVVGVRVAGREVGNRANVGRLARGAVGLLRRRGEALPEPRWDGLRILHDWIGDGYGTPHEGSERAIALAREVGLTLERTYTGRAFAACLAEVRRDRSPAVFVQTVDTVLPASEPAALPEALRGLLR